MSDDHIGVKINGIIYVKLDDVKPMRDRIEKLELVEKAYQQNQQTWSRNIARIEKLEEALREIANGQRDANKSYAELLAEVRIEARKALEGK